MGNKIKASDIAKLLGKELIGKDVEINSVCSADQIENGKLAFLSKNSFMENLSKEALFIVKENKEIDPKSMNSYIKISNPRLAFAKVVEKYFVVKNKEIISLSSKIGANVKIAEYVSIGENCIIRDNVIIGKNTKINHNVVIAENTIIGESCYLKSGSVIGEDGFGFDFEEDKTPVRLPHLGKVVIGDNVEIGANCTIARGTLHDTIINRNVKVDDQVHIAHNCVIGEKTIITAQAELSGSVVIGKNCWLGPNCSIIQKVKIGDNVRIGIGAIITGDINSNITIMGLESLPLRDLLRLKKRLELT